MKEKTWFWPTSTIDYTGFEAFYDAAKLLFEQRVFGSLYQREWRHHGLGMLQSELSESMRIHIWHPALVAPWVNEGLRAVHDHRFTITSAVLTGSIKDVWVDVALKDSGWICATPHEKTKMFEIANAKKQMKGDMFTREVGDVLVHRKQPYKLLAGDVYTIPRRLFHTTLVEEVAITFVHRGEFDDKPARVLENAESGIVPESPETRALIRDVVLKEARESYLKDYNMRYEGEKDYDHRREVKLA